MAARAGVAQPTVSLVLNGRTAGTYISEATRQRILDAAKATGYQPNQIARAMVMGRTKVIGVLGGISAEFVTRMLRGVVMVAQSKGYLVKILLAHGGDSQEESIQRAVQQRLAGVVSMHSDEAFLVKAQAELTKRGIPLVVVDHTQLNLGARQAPLFRVLSDDEQGMADAVAHLVQLGHVRIALITGGYPGSAWAAREKGYRKAMRKARLSVPAAAVKKVVGVTDTAECREALASLLRNPRRPTAIVCATDHIAMLVLQAAWDSGLRVPDDLSVVGFADLDMARYAHPPLTTVAQPFERMGEVVAARLLDAIDGKQTIATRSEVLPTRLIVRRSTAMALADGRTRLRRKERKERVVP
ncbi:MAG: LacI family DNA-binding transcriptional regulator [Kiritimatiellae bacterium]|nr:LacI family DNA-binding transcriptional regulator [Kiritimatiellia bacterium]